MHHLRTRGLLAGAAIISLCTSVGIHSQASQTGDIEYRDRVTAYEEICVSTLRLINTAEGTFRGADWPKGYTRTLKQLGPGGVDMIEPAVADGKKDGYQFRFVPAKTARNEPVLHYIVSARPIKRLSKNQKSFFTNETGIIRFTTENRAATVADPPIDSKRH